MIEVNFLKDEEIDDRNIKYVVIVPFFRNKLLVVRHKKRETWEIPGGHREDFERAEDAAHRELFEETGAREFGLALVTTYSVTREGSTNYGRLYYAEIEELGDLPYFEIDDIKAVKDLPENLTYPVIQPQLYKKVLDFMNR